MDDMNELTVIVVRKADAKRHVTDGEAFHPPSIRDERN